MIIEEYEYKAIIDQMNYEIFLAEESMKLTLRGLERKSKIVTEASDMNILNEAAGDAIMDFIRKVTQSIQKAWNNFKAKIDDTIIQNILERNKELLAKDAPMKLPDDFMYPDVKEWIEINNNCKVGSNILNSSSYAQMSEYLESPDKFYKQYYNEYVEEENGKVLSFSEVFEKRCFKKAVPNQIIKQTDIKPYVDFLKGYNNEQVKLIQEDIESINNVSQNVNSLLNSLSESGVFIGSIILEGENDQPQQTQSTITTSATSDPKENTKTFRSADPNNNKAAQKEKRGKDRKNITTYYKAMTQLLSAKMRTCNKVKSSALKIVTNYVRLQGGKTNFDKKDNNQQNNK